VRHAQRPCIHRPEADIAHEPEDRALGRLVVASDETVDGLAVDLGLCLARGKGRVEGLHDVRLRKPGLDLLCRGRARGRQEVGAHRVGRIDHDLAVNQGSDVGQDLVESRRGHGQDHDVRAGNRFAIGRRSGNARLRCGGPCVLRVACAQRDLVAGA